jgi:acid phosphatase family membrane protein YuiD
MTQNWERSRPGEREEEKAIELKGTLTSVSSYSSMQSSRVGMPSVSSAAVTSLSMAACAMAEPPGVPYFWTII